jgi:hypothetical protein
LNTDHIEDLIKNINWNLISLDGLLDFILNESKIIINNQETQKILINEFARRFKEEYSTSNQDNSSLNISASVTGVGVNNSPNFGNKQQQQNDKQTSFTEELITKLISKI